MVPSDGVALLSCIWLPSPFVLCNQFLFVVKFVAYWYVICRLWAIFRRLRAGGKSSSAVAQSTGSARVATHCIDYEHTIRFHMF